MTNIAIRPADAYDDKDAAQRWENRSLPTMIESVTSVLICCLGLGAAGAYFVCGRVPDRAGQSAWQRIETPAGLRLRARRRSLGMVIMGVVSVATFLGVEFLSTVQAPLAFVTYWLIVVLLVLWLGALGLIDAWQTVTIHRNWLARRRGISLDERLRDLGQSGRRPPRGDME